MLRLTNRFAGPICRLRQQLQGFDRGEAVAGMEFRTGDFWRDLAIHVDALFERAAPCRGDFQSVGTWPGRCLLAAGIGRARGLSALTDEPAGSLAAAGAAAVGFLEQDLAEPDLGRCDFHQFVVLDVFQGDFQREAAGRREDRCSRRCPPRGCSSASSPSPG